jgi:hypothetical protein
LAELAFQGLLPHMKERFSSQEFESLSHLIQKLSNVDRHNENHIPVHDRLGSRISVEDQLEVRANDRVPDEEPLNHDVEHQRNYRYDLEIYPR